MGKILVKRFDEPDEVVTVPRQTSQVVTLGETYVAWSTAQPGWTWSTDVKPLVGTPSCHVHHRGVMLSGQLLIRSDEGVERTIGPREAFEIQPGHEGWVVGEEPCVFIEFHGVRDWGKPRLGARVLTTLLFTDVVDSTRHAARLGDAEWKELLARHYSRVRLTLERWHGAESKTTGDGFLALFDSAARAASCAAEISRIAPHDGIEVRVGVHAGEVERYPDGVHGVGVHVAARIMALAGPGEVLLSAATAALLEGSGLELAGVGEFELKGLPGRRRLFRLGGDGAVSDTAVD